MEAFCALLVICAGNPPVTGEFPTQRPVKRSFDVFFDLRLNKLLSKRWWGWWFETPSRPVWLHRNVPSYITWPAYCQSELLRDIRQKLPRHSAHLQLTLTVNSRPLYVCMAWSATIHVIVLDLWTGETVVCGDIPGVELYHADTRWLEARGVT